MILPEREVGGLVKEIIAASINIVASKPQSRLAATLRTLALDGCFKIVHRQGIEIRQDVAAGKNKDLEMKV